MSEKNEVALELASALIKSGHMIILEGEAPSEAAVRLYNEIDAQLPKSSASVSVNQLRM